MRRGVHLTGSRPRALFVHCACLLSPFSCVVFVCVCVDTRYIGEGDEEEREEDAPDADARPVERRTRLDSTDSESQSEDAI